MSGEKIVYASLIHTASEVFTGQGKMQELELLEEVEEVVRYAIEGDIPLQTIQNIMNIVSQELLEGKG